MILENYISIRKSRKFYNQNYCIEELPETTTESDDFTTTAMPTETTPTETTTTIHPHTIPLPWAHTHFYYFTKESLLDYQIYHFVLHGRTMKPWGYRLAQYYVFESLAAIFQKYVKKYESTKTLIL